jgi:ribonuclease P protein component
VSDRSFSKSRRLLKSADFERVFKVRNSKSDRWLVVYACQNDVGHPRLGLVVSRKAGDAVQRNYWKRLLREAFRHSQDELPPLDFVMLPKTGAPPALSQVQQSLLDLTKRLSAQLEARPPVASSDQ